MHVRFYPVSGTFLWIPVVLILESKYWTDIQYILLELDLTFRLIMFIWLAMSDQWNWLLGDLDICDMFALENVTFWFRTSEYANGLLRTWPGNVKIIKSQEIVKAYPALPICKRIYRYSHPHSSESICIQNLGIFPNLTLSPHWPYMPRHQSMSIYITLDQNCHNLLKISKVVRYHHML